MTKKATATIPENVSLHYQDDRSDKVYHLQVEQAKGGYVVNFQFGRRGSTLQTGSKTPKPVTLDEALKIQARILREKLGKGYQVTNGAAQAAPVQPADSAPARTDYPAELLTEIPESQASSLLRDDRYWLQEKRDGQRRQIAKWDGQLTGYNRKGTTVPLPAALAQELATLEPDFILDGEIEGDQFIAFDLLDLPGFLAAGLPYATRFEALTRLLKGLRLASMVATWTTTKDKVRGAAMLHDARAEGLVFKLTSAPYSPGRNGQHYKHKFVKTCTAKVLRVGDKARQSVAVGLLEKGKWVDVGTVSTIGKPATQVGDLIEIRYLYATKARRLYQAIYIGKRDDLDASACTIEQLSYKQGVNR